MGKGRPQRTHRRNQGGTGYPDRVRLPFEEKIVGNSFRLDQKLAEELATAKPAALAATFLAAFFRDKSRAIEDRRRAHERLDIEWNALPPATRSRLAARTNPKRSDDSCTAILNDLLSTVAPLGTPGDEALIGEFGWLEESQLEWQRVLGLWSVEAETRTQIEQLLAQTPAQRLQETGVFTLNEVLARASELDSGVEGLRARVDALRELLPKAASVLQAASSLSLEEHAVRQRDLPQLMNDWLEATAGADLFARAHDMAECVQLVIQQADYNLDKDLASLLGQPWRKADLAALRKRHEELAKRRDTLHGQLTTPPGEASVTTAEAARINFATTPLDVDSSRRSTGWLTSVFLVMISCLAIRR